MSCSIAVGALDPCGDVLTCWLQTGFGQKYAERRDHARQTWFPATQAELDRYKAGLHILGDHKHAGGIALAL